MLQDTSKCFKIIQYNSEYFKIFQNNSKHFIMIQNSEYFIILQNPLIDEVTLKLSKNSRKFSHYCHLLQAEIYVRS